VAGEIVLGYDGQVASRAALRSAVSLASAFARPLVLVFGFEPNPLGGEVRDLRHAVRDVGEKITAEGVQDAKAIDAAVDVLVELVDDRPADAILRAADEHDAFAIVVGASNRGPLTGALLGSVTYQIVHRSTRPVLVVPAPDDA
jgi:nucleotide-binding universal stress UspA family protein